MLCWCLESGISNHMTFNEILRSNFWFGLGPILPQLTSIDRENTGMVNYHIIRFIHRGCLKGPTSAGL